ncbi:SMI1/KNR4 family protein [Stenotrophomonas sp. 278]|uniref:SMI1/KNR4 family protein n=1 Tax=Stenotrophomonas sp. 278 TaxID=2479851 RepID=UPI000F6713FB|nr:SMI1/KNR4 family protein [Stenotrophomonas sp. 278]RRU16043.1 SMI1/KNR4 family protein [Stenotrophomonas sp. 278]
MTLRERIAAHGGQFHCHQIHAEENQKTVTFAHELLPPREATLPDVPGLKDFYGQFGGLRLYAHQDDAEEAAFHVAHPSEWAALEACYRGWVDDEEDDEFLPSSEGGYLVVGEEPATGNYLLVQQHGEGAGAVVLFDHDGFEFVELGDSLLDFVERALEPDGQALTAMASHMRFRTEGSDAQWWIVEMRDNGGRVVRTEV